MRVVTFRALVLLVACVLPTLGQAARKEALEFRSVRLELPGMPAKVIPTDIDGDGRRDLLMVLAFTEIGTITEDRVEDLVQITTVIPATFDRRELRAYLAESDGGYRLAGMIKLPVSVVALAQAGEAAVAWALTDQGVDALRFDGENDPPLWFEPRIADRPVLAGNRIFFSQLTWIHDLDSDGDLDVLLPSFEGPSVYLSDGRRLSDRPVQRLSFAGDRTERGFMTQRTYPWPIVRDLNGDGLDDLHVAGESPHVMRGVGEGRFEPLYETGDCPAARTALLRAGDAPEFVTELDYLGDLDGDGHAEAVFSEILERGDGMRAGMKDAKRPRRLFRFYRLAADGMLEAQPYQELIAQGHAFEIDENSGAASLQQFEDLDGDGRMELIAVTFDFSMWQVIKIMTTKRIGIGLDFHVWSQDEGGTFREVPGLDLSEKLRFNLRNLQLGKFAQFAGDFDGDGRIDFVHLGRGSKVTIHRGQAGCRYPSKPDLVLELDQAAQHVGLVKIDDLDGDGRADLAVTRLLPAQREGETPPVQLDLYLSGAAR